MFDGNLGRRVHGASYWRTLLGKTPPPTLSNVAAPAGAVFLDGISDSETNYVDLEISQDPSTAAQGPSFPNPSCLAAADGGIDPSSAVAAISNFCPAQTGTVAAGSQPISNTYLGGEMHTIRLTLSWAASGNCPQSQSPSQNAGRDCDTFFHKILSGCEYTRS